MTTEKERAEIFELCKPLIEWAKSGFKSEVKVDAEALMARLSDNEDDEERLVIDENGAIFYERKDLDDEQVQVIIEEWKALKKK